MRRIGIGMRETMREIAVIPVCALTGENVCERSEKMLWY